MFAQFAIIIVLNMTQFTYLIDIRPYKSNLENKMAMINKAFTMVWIYLLMCLTDFVIDPLTRYKIGYISIALFGLALMTNIGTLVISSFC